MENGSVMISSEFLTLIIAATAVGSIARFFLIKIDHRQYPNYPNGYLIHLVTGIIAAALGAFIIPALVTQDFTAVTFLTIAVQQFRDVRKVERESLLDLEGDEYIRRGDAYIDGISKIFESRNYIALIVSFFTALVIQLMGHFLNAAIWVDVAAGAAVGLMIFLFLKYFTKRQKVIDIATVSEGRIVRKGSEVYVDGMMVTNLVGTEEGKKWIDELALAAVIHPNHVHFSIPLLNPGQRQAIIFEAARRLGQKKIYSFEDPGEEGKLIILIVPIIRDFDLLRKTILRTPILETVKKSHELLQPLKGEGTNA